MSNMNTKIDFFEDKQAIVLPKPLIILRIILYLISLWMARDLFGNFAFNSSDTCNVMTHNTSIIKADNICWEHRFSPFSWEALRIVIFQLCIHSENSVIHEFIGKWKGENVPESNTFTLINRCTVAEWSIKSNVLARSVLSKPFAYHPINLLLFALPPTQNQACSAENGWCRSNSHFLLEKFSEKTQHPLIQMTQANDTVAQRPSFIACV